MGRDDASVLVSLPSMAWVGSVSAGGMGSERLLYSVLCSFLRHHRRAGSPAILGIPMRQPKGVCSVDDAGCRMV